MAISATKMTEALDTWGKADGARAVQPVEGSRGLIHVCAWDKEVVAKLFSVVPGEDRKQWAQVETQENPFKHKKPLFYCENHLDKALSDTV